MTQKPETLFWNRLKEKIPLHWQVTRIENRYGGGIPDVYICAEGCSFWIELKVTKTNLWSGDDWSGLVGSLISISRGRVGEVGRVGSGSVGSGSGAVDGGESGTGTGTGTKSTDSWPGPGV